MALVVLTGTITNETSINQIAEADIIHEEPTTLLSESDTNIEQEITKPSFVEQGYIFMPVEGTLVSVVVDTWAAARPAGRLHEGQDIMAPRGVRVYSATYGEVERIGYYEDGGNFVMVAADGRRYYYAHLDKFGEIQEGEAVTPETVLGYVGNTGNAVYTPPHLHFGIYTSAGPINPLPLLVDRLRETITK